MKPVALTIAGSDSGGGAGIQADLKAMEAHGVFGTSVIAAVTAQNTQTVAMAYNLPTRIVRAQLDAVADDFDVAATKTGMLSTAEIIEAVAEKIQAHGLTPLVVDPVMVSKSGYRLLQADAVGAMRDVLLPLATLVTPNTHEAAILAGHEPFHTLDGAKAAAEAIHALGPGAVLVKGGHLRDDATSADVLFDGQAMRTFSAPRIETPHTHGTGCTYASSIAAGLAHGRGLEDAIDRAKRYVTAAIRHALPLGHGRGPTNHFFHLDAEQAVPAE